MPANPRDATYIDTQEGTNLLMFNSSAASFQYEEVFE